MSAMAIAVRNETPMKLPPFDPFPLGIGMED